jgi:hypothetical protein
LGYPSLIYELGAPLEENKLSVYAPNQEWLLQGDYLLDTVNIYSSKSGQNPYWVNKDGNVASWADYHRLNLVLPSGSSVEWNVRLPDEADRIDLVSSLITDYDTSEVEIQVGLPNSKMSRFEFNADNVDRLPIEISIAQYAGQIVRIVISPKGENGTEATLDSPKIKISGDQTSSSPLDGYHPQNVIKDFEPKGNFYEIWPSRSDKLIFDTLDAERNNFYKREGNASLRLDFEDGVCVYNETSFYIKILIDPSISSRFGKITMHLKNLEGIEEYIAFYLPYLADGNSHTYLYPLRLHLTTSPSYLDSIEIIPLQSPGVASFQIESLGLFDPRNTFDKCN